MLFNDCSKEGLEYSFCPFFTKSPWFSSGSQSTAYLFQAPLQLWVAHELSVEVLGWLLENSFREALLNWKAPFGLLPFLLLPSWNKNGYQKHQKPSLPWRECKEGSQLLKTMDQKVWGSLGAWRPWSWHPSPGAPTAGSAVMWDHKLLCWLFSFCSPLPHIHSPLCLPWSVP